MGPGPGTVHSTGGGGYTGPGDVITFGFWVGLRAYNGATAGTKAINLCDNAGANCADINTNASTGVLNNPGTLGANNCNTSGTCLIKTFYNKTASGATNDCTQATAANMAALNMTGGPGGTSPAAIFTRAAPTTYDCGVQTGITDTQPFTQTTVAERTATFTNFNTVIGSGGPDLLFNSSANGCGGYANAVLVDTTHCADSAWHLIMVLYNNASAKVQLGNNTPVAGTIGAAVGTAHIQLGTGIGGNLDGRIAEVGAIASDQSANFNSLYTNENGFWGGL
jgi:hypothetical protein